MADWETMRRFTEEYRDALLDTIGTLAEPLITRTDRHGFPHREPINALDHHTLSEHAEIRAEIRDTLRRRS